MRFSLTTALALLLLAAVCVEAIWAQDAGESRLIDLEERIQRMAISPDGEMLAIASGNGSNLKLVEASTGEVTFEFGKLFETFSPDFLEYSPSGEYLIASSSHRGVKVLTLTEDGREVEDHSGFKIENNSDSIGIARDTPLLAGFTHRGVLTVYDFIAGTEVAKVDLSDFQMHSVDGIHLSAKGGHALIFNHRCILLVDVEEGKVLQRMQPESYMSDMSFSQDGTQLLGMSSSDLLVLNLQTGDLRQRGMEGYSHKVNYRDQQKDILIFHENSLSLRDARTFKETFTKKFAAPGENDEWTNCTTSRNGRVGVLRNRDYLSGKLLIVDLPDK